MLEIVAFTLGPVQTNAYLIADPVTGDAAVIDPAWDGDVILAEAKRRGLRETYLHSQSHAKDFYARHGYVVEGDEYFEAGIPHIGMRARL